VNRGNGAGGDWDRELTRGPERDGGSQINGAETRNPRRTGSTAGASPSGSTSPRRDERIDAGRNRLDDDIVHPERRFTARTLLP
jgi:hypothetical protein